MRSEPAARGQSRAADPADPAAAMPFLHRKPFERKRPPPDLRPDERFFYCRVTNEIFRDYDEFFERTILCNSLVWSCAITGKAGLTYQEAMESEKKARRNIQNFPEPLIGPVLYLTSRTRRARLHEVCEDLFAYLHNRFFVGESVDVLRNSGARLQCTILEVKAPPKENGMVNGHTETKPNVAMETIVISDSDEESETPRASAQNGKRPTAIDPSLFKYKVKPIKQELYESVTVKACQISRKPTLFSRERLKLFLKLHCELHNGAQRPKATSMIKYKVCEKSFSEAFPDEPPAFASSLPAPQRKPPKHRVVVSPVVSPKDGFVNRPVIGVDQYYAAMEREKLLALREEMQAMAYEKAKMQRAHFDVMEAARRREREEREKEREELRKMMEEERLKKKEEKERQKMEREKEREKLREEKRKHAEYVKLWRKPREDLECDDLKDLPAPTPVKTRLPPECFGDALMVLEFLHAFGELFDLQDEFPEGISLEVLEEALVGNNADGPLCELLFFFLTAIFEAMAEEEEEVAKEQIAEADTKDLTEALDEDADPTKTALSAVASLAAAWPQLHQGCSLKSLDLDSCTLSEILRLHILASGADVTTNNAKYRYQKRGGFDATDDAGMELRLNHPGLLKKLSNCSVYDLSPEEKLKILHALCGKLLTLVSTRDFIEDYMEILRQSKQEFRELKAEQNRRERGEAAAKIRKRKEEKLKEQEMRLKEIQERLKEHENRVLKEAGERILDLTTDVKGQERYTVSEDEDGFGKESQGNKKQNGTKAVCQDVEVQEPLSADEEGSWRPELQRKEEELLEKIQSATTCTNVFPLGRDRLYRRYWIFAAVPGLFVEEDYSGLTEDMLVLRPSSISIKTELSQEPITIEDTQDSVESASPSPVASPQPVNRPNRWFYYGSSSQLDELIESLNNRGLRESALKEVLVQEKFRICEKLIGACVERYHITDKPAMEAKPPARGRGQEITPLPAEKHMELRLRDLLLDIEDRIYQGTLGTLKVFDRPAWREALESGRYELLVEEVKENGISYDSPEMDLNDQAKLSLKERLSELKTDGQSTGSSNTPQLTNNNVHYLALALLQIEQGVERRFLKPPLGDVEDNKKDQKWDKKRKDDRKKKDEDQSSERDDASDNGRLCRTVLDRWRESLIISGSLSQIFLHLSTLERSIIWAKSILNTRCRVCRRKGDAECMVLCDICDRGYHTYCVRPKLKGVPEGDWFCPECRPKARVPRVSSRQRSSMESDNDEEEEDEEEEGEEEEDEDEDIGEEQEDEDDEAEEDELAASGEEEQEEAEEEESEAGQSPPKRGRRSEQLLKARGGKSRGGRGVIRQDTGMTSRSQQSTPKQGWHAARGRGRGRGGSRGRGSAKKAMSEPIPETKPTSRMASRNRHSYIPPEPESSDESLTEEMKQQGKGRGRGRGRGGRGRWRGSKTAENTPDRSPYTFRLFQLDGADSIPGGRQSYGSPQNLPLVITEPSGRGRKRQSTDRSGMLSNLVEQVNRRSSGRGHGVHELSACEQLVVELVRHDDSWPFMKLVSKIQVPDYYDIIKRPIALNIIREKVNKCEYKVASEFIEDIELMFANCFEYNPVHTSEAKAGARLQSFFHSQAQKLGLDLAGSRPDTATTPQAKKSRI